MPRIKLTSRLKDKQELKWDFVCVYCCFGKLSLVAIVRFHVCRLCCGRTIKTVKSDVEDCLPSNLMCLTWDPRRSGLEKKKTCVASVASPVYSRGFLILWAKPEKGGLDSQLFFRDLTTLDKGKQSNISLSTRKVNKREKKLELLDHWGKYILLLSVLTLDYSSSS